MAREYFNAIFMSVLSGSLEPEARIDTTLSRNGNRQSPVSAHAGMLPYCCLRFVGWNWLSRKSDESPARRTLQLCTHVQEMKTADIRAFQVISDGNWLVPGM
jgi:hypothetical protein